MAYDPKEPGFIDYPTPTEEFPTIGHLILELHDWSHSRCAGSRIMSRPAVSAEEWGGKSVDERAALIRQMFQEAGDAIARQYVSREAVTNGNS